jgi:hypothetical protein
LTPLEWFFPFRSASGRHAKTAKKIQDQYHLIFYDASMSFLSVEVFTTRYSKNPKIQPFGRSKKELTRKTKQKYVTNSISIVTFNKQFNQF